MQVINSRTFHVAPADQVTFSVLQSQHVSGASGSGAAASGPLPLTVTGPQRVTIGVMFTMNSGAFADIEVADGTGGVGVDRIDQVPGVGFRTRTYLLI